MNREPNIADDVTERIIGSAFKVANTLGIGFLEKVYENALALEMYRRGLRVSRQNRMIIRYDGVVVGTYTADLMVEDMVIVELKSVRALTDQHNAQCMNYLRAAGRPLCLLINFGRPRLEIRRIVSTQDRPRIRPQRPDKDPTNESSSALVRAGSSSCGK